MQCWQPQWGCIPQPKVAVLGYLGERGAVTIVRNPNGVASPSPRLPYSATLGTRRTKAYNV